MALANLFLLYLFSPKEILLSDSHDCSWLKVKCTLISRAFEFRIANLAHGEENAHFNNQSSK